MPRTRPAAIDTPSVNASTRRIERDLVDARNEVVADTPTSNCRLTPARTRPSSAAGEREQHALGQELRDDVAAPRAEREADADLLAPAREAREHEVGDVGAGDQQHRGDGGEQHRVGLALVADQVVEQVADVDLRLRVDVGRMGLA